MIIHVVEENQTIESIASQYGVNSQRLAYDNQLASDEPLVIGQALVVLVPDIIHITQEGEGIESIAEQYGVSPLTIYRNNPYLIFEPALETGEPVVISFQGDKQDSMFVDGYAYTYISNDVLIESLLYLNSLSIFSYGFTTQGELREIDDDRLIELCNNAGVKPILVLTPFDDNGVFSNQLVNVLLEDNEVQETLIDNLFNKMVEKGYVGINVDFEYILPEDKDRYVEFIRKLKARVGQNGYTVSVCLSPKTSVDQKGLLYEGIDYKALGEVADYVLCMTYEWGYTFSPPMSVSPINKVQEVLNFAVSQIPSEKILMGMSNYGYDWPLPYVRGESKATTIGNVQAIQIAREQNARIQFDELSQTPFFRYTQDGVEHEVWFEDARSINARLELVPLYGLKGVAYWQLMKMFRQNFMVLNNVYEIER